MKLNRKLFFIAIAGMVAAEVLSFVAHQNPILQTPFFIGFVLIAIALTAWRLEYGLFLLVADQLLGSQGGRLFGVTVHGFALSARMALFGVVMAMWTIRAIGGRYNEVLKACGHILALWSWLGIAWILGMARALWIGTPLGDVIMDANAYLYALLVLPIVSVAKREHATPVLTVFAAGLTMLACKTFGVFYWFSHIGDNALGTHARALYTWIRDTRVGEITLLEGSFPRVFIQGQIWLLLGLFGILAFALTKTKKEFFATKLFLASSVMAALVLGSFSRSFWAGLVIVVLGTLVYLVTTKKIREAGRFVGYGSASACVGVVILAAVMLVPWPYPSTVGSLAAFRNRVTNLNESALQSRWELARPLLHAIAQTPILGSGFGKRVTYISKDPRNLAINPTGEYSTFSFEWGYGDLWLKMGVFGLAAYGFIIWNLGKWSLASAKNKIATLLPLVTLAIVHFFTPYLNHPLGLGVLLVYSGIASVLYCPKRLMPISG